MKSLFSSSSNTPSGNNNNASQLRRSPSNGIPVTSTNPRDAGPPRGLGQHVERDPPMQSRDRPPPPRQSLPPPRDASFPQRPNLRNDKHQSLPVSRNNGRPEDFYSNEIPMDSTILDSQRNGRPLSPSTFDKEKRPFKNEDKGDDEEWKKQHQAQFEQLLGGDQEPEIFNEGMVYLSQVFRTCSSPPPKTMFSSSSSSLL